MNRVRSLVSQIRPHRRGLGGNKTHEEGHEYGQEYGQGYGQAPIYVHIYMMSKHYILFLYCRIFLKFQIDLGASHTNLKISHTIGGAGSRPRTLYVDHGPVRNRSLEPPEIVRAPRDAPGCPPRGPKLPNWNPPRCTTVQ